jgi:pimeloyl-ACP methyl ester carboxylesterase
LVALIACAGCRMAHGAEPPATDPGPLVFIHGIKGAELLDDDDSVAWVTAAEALGLSTPDLSLKTTFGADGKQPAGPFHAGPILRRITVIPVVATVDIYGSFLEAAAAFGYPFYEYSYDWRRDNNETLAAFLRFLEGIKARHGGAKVRVIGHSMGGLLTMAAVNARPDLVAKAVIAGSPLAGGIGFLPDLTDGDDTGLNHALLAPPVLATFPSVFCFFPLEGGGLVGPSGGPLPVDFYDAGSWERLKLGPYASGAAPAGYGAFLRDALARAKEFRGRLAPAKVAYPPLLIVAGNAVPTLSEARQGGPKARHGWDFASERAVPGDGRVAYEHALPAPGIPYRVVTTDRAHAALLGDPKVVADVQAFLGQY